MWQAVSTLRPRKGSGRVIPGAPLVLFCARCVFRASGKPMGAPLPISRQPPAVWDLRAADTVSG